MLNLLKKYVNSEEPLAVIMITRPSWTIYFLYYRQEYLNDIYEALAETGNPRLLQALENFIETTSDTLSQKDIENERLDTALRR